MKQLKEAKVPAGCWTLGGGTVLRMLYNHRTSNDIDIFLNNPQILTYVSPRVNDAVEKELSDYNEASNYIKLIFAEGKIDFIVAPNISSVKPAMVNIEGCDIFVDDPVEIVSKKLFYRSDSLKERDIFDLAFVYSKTNGKLAEAFSAIPGIGGKLENLKEYLDETPQKLYDEKVENGAPFTILPEGRTVRGKEISLCREFLEAAKRNVCDTKH